MGAANDPQLNFVKFLLYLYHCIILCLFFVIAMLAYFSHDFNNYVSCMNNS